jgi:hypothetical protein
MSQSEFHHSTPLADYAPTSQSQQQSNLNSAATDSNLTNNNGAGKDEASARQNHYYGWFEKFYGF